MYLNGDFSSRLGSMLDEPKTSQTTSVAAALAEEAAAAAAVSK